MKKKKKDPNDNLSVKNQTLVFVTVTLIIFFAILSLMIYMDQKEKLQKAQKAYHENMKNSYEKIINKYQHFYEFRIRAILDIEGVKEAFGAKDREKLFELVNPQFQELKNENPFVEIMHFHLYDGTTLLRVHKKDVFGDNISKIRAMAAAMHRDKKHLHGFEAGIHKLAYREFLPVFYKDDYIGSVEIGINPSQILYDMKYYNTINGALFQRENKIIQQKQKSDYKIGEYALSFNSMDDLELIKKLKSDYDKSSNIEIYHKGKIYAVYSFDLLDYRESLSAKAIFFHDITDIKNGFTQTFNQLLFLLFSLLVLLIFTIHIGFSKMIKKLDRANKRLKETNEELETIFSTTKDGIAIFDFETNFLFANNAYAAITGYTVEELLEKKCTDLSLSDDLPRIYEALSEISKKGFLNNIEKVCIRKDTTMAHVDMSVALMPDKKSILVFARDVTESRKSERLLQEYVRLVDKNIIISSTDLEGIITQVSEKFCQITGYDKEELIGSNHNIIRHPDMKPEVYKNLWDTISKDETWHGEIKNIKKDGSAFWAYATISAVYDNGKKIGYTAIRQDITDKKIIEEISITDGLTNIYNRRHFNETFPKILNSAKRKNELIHFALMDVDNFKLYNDNYGHQAGDSVLIAFAKCLKNSVNRADDYVFRLGGEEFGIIFKSQTKEEAVAFIMKIKQNIEDMKIEHTHNDASPYITASIGLVSRYAKEINSIDEVYKEADDFLYVSKNNGRNRLTHN